MTDLKAGDRVRALRDREGAYKAGAQFDIARVYADPPSLQIVDNKGVRRWVALNIPGEFELVEPSVDDRPVTTKPVDDREIPSGDTQTVSDSAAGGAGDCPRLQALWKVLAYDQLLRVIGGMGGQDILFAGDMPDVDAAYDDMIATAKAAILATRQQPAPASDETLRVAQQIVGIANSLEGRGPDDREFVSVKLIRACAQIVNGIALQPLTQRLQAPASEAVREALEPFALMSTEGVITESEGFVTITTCAEYFHRAASAYAAQAHPPQANTTTPASSGVEVTQDTVAFVQEWMLSSDYKPDAWTRSFAAAIDARHRTTQTAELTAEVGRMRAELQKHGTRFEHCADMISQGFAITGTLRAEHTIKAKHYAMEARAALGQPS